MSLYLIEYECKIKVISCEGLSLQRNKPPNPYIVSHLLDSFSEKSKYLIAAKLKIFE